MPGVGEERKMLFMPCPPRKTLGRPVYWSPPREKNNLRSVLLWGLVPTPRKCAYLSTISAPACKHKTGDHMCSSLCRYLLLPAYCIDAPSDLAPVLITSLPSSGTKSKGCVFQDTLFLNPDRSPFRRICNSAEKTNYCA
ncbi:hypothetical protein CISG_08413 [Coccidioides immitis RMSCC 3703]|uniref:Uncharacterized protein n=1 Tax=Coccidioides immitis RMSCC 3703 TaxID=454286 RepID=A0A0J8R5K1_COCIT|nr:hypothetical protein CISG_08413 [Coccidioides immitis RMSCC 3703]